MSAHLVVEVDAVEQHGCGQRLTGSGFGQFEYERSCRSGRRLALLTCVAEWEV